LSDTGSGFITQVNRRSAFPLMGWPRRLYQW